MPFIDANGTQFNYQIDGPDRAPVVVLSNSLGTTLSMWDSQVPTLSQKFRVLRYDMRGHGLTPVTPGPYTIEGLARDVIGLLDALTIERAHFCGISVGGALGQWLGVNAADHLNRLVLSNTAARIGTQDGWNARIKTVREGGMASVADAVVSRWFTDGFVKKSPAVVEATRQMLLRTPPEGYVATCAALREMDQRETVARVSVRTLVIAGAHDAVTTPVDAHFLVDRIHAAQHVELNSAHLSNIEDAEAFTTALINFLTQQEGK
ncbi:MAG: 3-oxoadipate enol-lactonase [Candidatus Acidiferrales bacterium]